MEDTPSFDFNQISGDVPPPRRRVSFVAEQKKPKISLGASAPKYPGTSSADRNLRSALVVADCISLVSPQAARLAHFVAPPLPTRPACAGLARGPLLDPLCCFRLPPCTGTIGTHFYPERAPAPVGICAPVLVSALHKTPSAFRGPSRTPAPTGAAVSPQSGAVGRPLALAASYRLRQQAGALGVDTRRRMGCSQLS